MKTNKIEQLTNDIINLNTEQKANLLNQLGSKMFYNDISLHEELQTMQNKRMFTGYGTMILYAINDKVNEFLSKTSD